MRDFFSGFEKKAAEEPGWWEKQKGVNRAMRSSDKGIGKILANNELVGSRTKKGLAGMGIGGLSGAALGGLVGEVIGGHGASGAIGGALLGGIIGENAGIYQADKEYLGKRGITPKYFGLSADFSPEAKKKYITDPQKKRLKELGG